MTPLPTRSGRNDRNIPNGKIPGKTPLRLQAWLAAALMFCPWLATVFLCQPLFRDRPLSTLTLLPGLMVAVYLQRQLFTHLDANHRSGEADRPFLTLGAASWITLLRAAAIVALAGFLPLAVQPTHTLPPDLVWVPGLLYLGISLADLLDGFMARKQRRETELGKRLDMETDAAGLLVAVLVAVSLGRLPLLSLLVGLAYYLFIAGIWWRQQRHLPLVALQSRPYSRIIAGFQMGVVALAMLPIFNPDFTFFAASLIMTPLLAGFVRDWLVVSCRIETDGSQQTVLDHWATLRLTHYFPLVLRLILLTGGILVLAGGGGYPSYPFWQWTLSLSCLLAAIGCMGRSAALLLTLVLSCNLIPFGTFLSSPVLFGAAATLMLTGTGCLSLWSPEERLLYRRPLGGSKKEDERP
jgi:CDP-diacylglycerol---glycerol-3-phosphate 3-phosphatidyltransferase